MIARLSSPNLKMSAPRDAIRATSFMFFHWSMLDLIQGWQGIYSDRLTRCCAMDRMVHVFCHHSFLDQEQLEGLPPSLLNVNIILQKCPILELERSVAIDSLCCLEKVVHVMLTSKALNNFGFLFPPLVFNVCDLLLGSVLMHWSSFCFC